MAAKPRVGLILPGGGARNAYQVGVLKAISEMIPESSGNPFPVISGTSAGAINTGMLASRADDFHEAVYRLEGLWSHLEVHKIYDIGPLKSVRSSAALLWSMARSKSLSDQPKSLLDCNPLRAMLEGHINLSRINQCVEQKHLHSVGITTSSYTSGKSITYFTGCPCVKPWDRSHRRGVKDYLGLDHFMASSAIPLVFPAVRIRNDFHGDGSMRQTAPLSPGLHMGANRLLVISVSNLQNQFAFGSDTPQPYPTIGQILGYSFESLFLETLEADVERLNRLNEIIQTSGQHSLQLKDKRLDQVKCLVITPSRDVNDVVQAFIHTFPKDMNLMLRILGASHKEGQQISSYLLFQGAFCKALIDLGYQDGWAKRDEILDLLASDEEA